MKKKEEAKKASSRSYEEYLHECVEDCDCHYGKGYCFILKYLELLHPELNFLVQIKCIDKFKYDESRRQGKDIGEEEAFRLWVDRKYAEEFRNVFSVNLHINEIYDLIIKRIERNAKKK